VNSAAWWITYAILGLYGVNAVWLLALGYGWAAGYWLSAACITICAMKGLVG